MRETLSCFINTTHTVVRETLWNNFNIWREHATWRVLVIEGMALHVIVNHNAALILRKDGKLDLLTRNSWERLEPSREVCDLWNEMIRAWSEQSIKGLKWFWNKVFGGNVNSFPRWRLYGALVRNQVARQNPPARPSQVISCVEWLSWPAGNLWPLLALSTPHKISLLHYFLIITMLRTVPCLTR